MPETQEAEPTDAGQLPSDTENLVAEADEEFDSEADASINWPDQAKGDGIGESLDNDATVVEESISDEDSETTNSVFDVGQTHEVPDTADSRVTAIASTLATVDVSRLQIDENTRLYKPVTIGEGTDWEQAREQQMTLPALAARYRVGDEGVEVSRLVVREDQRQWDGQSWTLDNPETFGSPDEFNARFGVSMPEGSVRLQEPLVLKGTVEGDFVIAAPLAGYHSSAELPGLEVVVTPAGVVPSAASPSGAVELEAAERSPEGPASRD